MMEVVRATKRKSVQINEPDRCGADFERIPATNTNDLLVAGSSDTIT
jgi:hypothetical protein